jgi:hypothetical protein
VGRTNHGRPLRSAASTALIYIYEAFLWLNTFLHSYSLFTGRSNANLHKHPAVFPLDRDAVQCLPWASDLHSRSVASWKSAALPTH